MYTRPEWTPTMPDAAFALIEAVTLGTVISSSPQGLEATHLPFMIDRHRGAHGTLISHLALANTHAASLEQGAECLVIFHGPHGYISSSWYPGRPAEAGARNNAPTWNFAAVHAHGRSSPLSESGKAQHIVDLVAHLDRGRPRPWSVKELGPGGMKRRMPHIVGFEIEISRLSAKFKMGQDEPLADTEAAIAHLACGENIPLATLMSELNQCRHPKEQP